MISSSSPRRQHNLGLQFPTVLCHRRVGWPDLLRPAHRVRVPPKLHPTEDLGTRPTRPVQMFRPRTLAWPCSVVLRTSSAICS